MTPRPRLLPKKLKATVAAAVTQLAAHPVAAAAPTQLRQLLLAPSQQLQLCQL